MRKLVMIGVSVLAGVSLAIPMVQPALAASSFQWVSQAYAGGNTGDVNNGLFQRGLSDDGRYMLFVSSSSTVVPNDTNNLRDVFVRDTQTGTNELVTQSTAGVQANDETYDASISGNGRYVVFASRATNLTSGAGSGAQKVYLRDLQDDTTTLICADIYGNDCDSAAISSDGRFILYRQYEIFNNFQYFRYDRTTGARDRVSQSQSGTIANGLSVSRADMSADGRYVVYTSTATNLVPNDTNGKVDAFKRDMQTGAVTRVNTAANGAQANGNTGFSSISDNGRYVTFTSDATNLTGTSSAQSISYIKDTTSGSIGYVGGTPLQAEGYITGNGLYVSFVTTSALSASDTNTTSDVYIWNRGLNTTSRVTEDASGNNLPQGLVGSWMTGFATPNGRYVPFTTTGAVDPGDTNDGNDVYIADMGAGFPDTTRPIVAFTSPSSFEGPFTSGPLVSVSASDPGSGLAVLVIHVYNSSGQLLNYCGSANATQLAAGAYSCDLSSLPAGSYFIKAGANDNAGNNRTIISGTFTIEE